MRHRVMTGIGLLWLAALVPLAARAEVADFTLREQLGHTWVQECVTYPLTPEQRAAAVGGKALVGADGKEVAWQLVPGTGEGDSRIRFQADLAPFESRGYRFSAQPVAAKTDLEFWETADELCLANRVTGLKLRRKLTAGLGPIAGVRLRSGAWTGGSTFVLAAKAAITSYGVEVKVCGPVFAEVECRATFADKGTWMLRFRLESGEPVILVEESFDAPAGGTFTVLLGDQAFRPTHMLNRDSRAEAAAVQSEPIGGYFLEPWLHWNNARHGNWIALFTPSPAAPAKTIEPTAPGAGDKGNAELDALVAEAPVAPKATPADKRNDMLMIGLLKPSLWVDPQWKGHAEQVGPNAQVTVRDGVAAVELPVKGGRRAWMLGVLDKSKSEELLAQANRRLAPPPQKLLIKHGDFPLDKVRNFVLDWPGDQDNHPLLYIRKQDVPALKARLKSNPAELKRWTGQQPIDKYFLDGPIREFIATGDPKLGSLMAAKAEEYLQTCTDWYLKQDYLHCPGTAPHMQSLIMTTLNLIDPVLSSEAFTPESRQRVLAKLAFLGYVVSSSDYWSPERGYSGFANMTSVVALYRTALGCMLPSHPRAKAWAEQGLGQLSWQLHAWSDTEGGWLEAPHYGMVSLDHMLAGFAMAANAGYGDYGFDPRLRKVFEWFATISTPRDSRTGGFRHQPPIGNTYHGEPSGICGIAAGQWKERDPEFAARMQWMFEQGGSFGNLGIGWNFPSGLGYRFLMKENGVVAKPAEFGSSWFPSTGVVLRNTMQSDRETYLHLIAGSNHDHYDVDSGSILLYGKGRVLADDWGYIGMHPDKWHSMLTSAEAGGGGILNVDVFAPAASLDYVSGRKGAWQRQIAFAKDADPLGPNFFLIRDTHTGASAATWRLWLTTLRPGAAAPAAARPPTAPGDTAPDGVALDDPAKNAAAPVVPVRVHAQGATVIGAEDVDLDIFIYDAAKLDLKTSTESQKASCGYRNGKDGPVENTQTALIATLAGQGAVAALLYPRLKTEKSPKVTWFADGRGAQVESAAGTDCVFVAPRPACVESDGKTLLPLSDRTVGYDRPMRVRGSASTPHLLVNNRDSEAGDEKKFRMPPHSVVVHPGPKNPVTAVWQSPITGTVSVEVRVQDADPGKIDTELWRNDGVLFELRQGAKTLGKGAATDAGPEARLAVENISVAKGELLRLVILPGGCEWWDSTRLEMVVTQAGGQKWDLREALVRGNALGNDLSGGDRLQAVWWVCEGDAETFGAAALNPPPPETFAAPDGKVRFQGTAGAVQLRGDKAIMTLGAAGRIRVGAKELAADAASTRTETTP